MISIACDHPDIEDFITIKSDLDKVTKANISIRVTDDFMNAVIHNKDFELKFTREETGEVIKKVVKANEIFGKFCEMNWDYAEPAFLFWDRIEKYNLLEYVDDFKYAGVNPCAEEPLPEGGSCLLGSLNLAEFVEDGVFNYKEFGEAVKIAVDGLNDVLDEGLPLHPLKEQRDSVRDWRQIGLGIMGLADMLIKLGIEYGSEESIDVCDSIGYALASTAIHESANLAHKYGSFPKFTDDVYKSRFYDFHKSLPLRRPLRNSQLLTIAPTGTLSTMLGIGGGIEPIFANSYTRKTESLHGEDVEYKVYTPIVEKYMKEHNITKEEDLPSFFVTSANIPHRNRIDMQAIWQRHIDASISSTVNLPNSATVEDIKDLYIYAWKKGLKGITVFRDGCKRAGILTTNPKESNKSTETKSTFSRGDIISVNDDLIGYKRKVVNGCGDFQFQLFFDDVTGEPLESYICMGDGGGCSKNIEAISRLISLCFRAGVDVSEVIKQLKKVPPCISYCNRAKAKGDTSVGTSCPSAIGYALDELNNKIQDRCFANFDEEEYEGVDIYNGFGEIIDDDMTCPECGEPLYHEGGCDVCRSCGYSHCG